MNWKEIKYSYPLAFDALNEWYGLGLLEFHKTENRFGHYFTYGVHVVEMWNDFEIRDLYDFFDFKEIFVEVNIETTSKLARIIFKGFHIKIYDTKKNVFGLFTDSDNINTRPKAETEAFTKAFEILDNQLNNEVVKNYKSKSEHNITGRGKILVIENDKDGLNDDFIVGNDICINSVIYEIRGIETRGINRIRKGDPVGVLVKLKKQP